MKKLIATMKNGSIRRTAAPPAVLLWFICLLQIFYAGHIYSNDTLVKMEAARTFVRHNGFYLDPAGKAWGVTGTNDRLYPHFSIGSILVYVPLAWTLHQCESITGATIPWHWYGAGVTGMSLLFTAGIGVLFFLLFLNLHVGASRAFLLSNAVVFSSELFPYSNTGWSEPGALFFAVAGIFFFCYKNNTRTFKPWALFSICSGIAVLIRIEYIVFFMLFLLFNMKMKKHELALTILSAGSITGIWCMHLLFNLHRFGSLWDFGFTAFSFHPTASPLIESVTQGASFLSHTLFGAQGYWFALSFGRNHWFWVSPLLALVPLTAFYWGAVPLIIRRLFLTALTCTPLYVFFINTQEWSCNNWCWGFRYWYTVFPFLLLPIAWFPLHNKILKAVFILLGSIGVGIGIFASVVNYHTVLERMVHAYGYANAMWGVTMSFSHAPIRYHLLHFPSQALHTAQLLFTTADVPPWRVLRETCLNIWPVGLSGAGVPPWIAFTAWFCLLAASLLFAYCIVRKMFFTTTNSSKAVCGQSETTVH